MRALVIAMVLSLLASGGALADKNDFYDEVEWRYEKRKTTPIRCKRALSEGTIIFSGTNKEKSSGGIIFVTRVMDIYFMDSIYRFEGDTHRMKCQSFRLIEKK